MGHTGAALPLAVVRARAPSGRAHAKDLRRYHLRHGWTGVGHRGDRRRQGHRARRLHHSRGRRRHHGGRSRELRDQLVVPDLGRAEPLHYRRRRVCFQRRQESDAHHHGYCVARFGPYSRAYAAQGAVVDRRTTIKWVLAASVSWPLLRGRSGSAGEAEPAEPALALKGYGTDPDLLKTYHPGDVWPLTLTPAQRQLAGVLSDLIIPADEHSGSASSVGVVDFLDEWVSAPYPDSRRDRPM